LYEQKERKLYSVKFPKLEALLFKEQKLYKQQEKRDFIIEGETVTNFIKKKKAFHDEYKKTMRKERVSWYLLFDLHRGWYIQNIFVFFLTVWH